MPVSIEIDFDVFKSLTAHRKNESDSYNDVLRRLLRLNPIETDAPANELSLAGLWISNVHFPDGTRFRATYKGKAYAAEVKNSEWIDENGKRHSSPSAAATAITHTTVNGWRFWYAKRPGDNDWRLLEEFKSS